MSSMSHQALGSECHDLVLGQHFGSLQDFKVFLRKWAIEQNFTLSILDSDSRRVRAGCRSTPDCPFRVRCNFNEKSEGATITTLDNIHNCASNSHYGLPRNVSRAETSKLKFLLEAVPNLLTVDQSTPPKAIIDAVRQKYGTEIALRQAQKVKANLCPRPRGSGEQLYEPRVGDDRLLHEQKESRHDPTTGHFSPTLNDDSDMHVDFHDGDLTHLGQHRTTGEEEPSSTQQQELLTVAPLPIIPTNMSTPDGRNTVVHMIPQPSQALSMPQPFSEAAMANGPIFTADSSNSKTPQEIRAEAAALFQRASEKFQEASRLHAEATRLFASVVDS